MRELRELLHSAGYVLRSQVIAAPDVLSLCSGVGIPRKSYRTSDAELRTASLLYTVGPMVVGIGGGVIFIQVGKREQLSAVFPVEGCVRVWHTRTSHITRDTEH